MPRPKNFTFEITVGEVEAMNAAIKIVPTDETATFCWMVAPWDGQKTATEVMDDIVAQYGNFMNNGAMLYKGVQDYTGGPGSRINTNSMLPIPTTTSLPSAMPAV